MKLRWVVFVAVFVFAFSAKADFLADQKKFSKVKTAFTEKKDSIKNLFKRNKIDLNFVNLIFVAYKEESKFEVYAKNKQDSKYKKVQTYKICSKSGEFGPKRKEGDRQVPEGFYNIDRFNPSSNFYLSLGTNYPNKADRLKSKAERLGGDIFIHGSCVTVGCLPMTDEFIKEIYLMAVYAKNNGQLRIPVYIFPFEMSDKNMSFYKTEHSNNTELIKFWENLKMGYVKFMNEMKEVKVVVNTSGDYVF